MTVTHFDQNGAEQGTAELNPTVFGVTPHEALLHRAVVAHLANRRQGTAAAKNRSDVVGTTSKPYRQKKTGNARLGDRKSPQQRGGGVYGGPIPRSYRKKMNRKERRLALKSALSLRASEDAVVAIEDPVLESGKTRDMVQLMEQLELEGTRVLLVTHDAAETLLRAARNIPKLKLVRADALHPYQVLWAERVVVCDSALEALSGGNAPEEEAPATEPAPEPATTAVVSEDTQGAGDEPEGSDEA